MLKKVFSALLTCVLLVSLIPSAFAASGTRKGFTISNSNVTVYSDTSLTRRLGTIYPTDEVTVMEVTSRYVKLTYPLDKGGTRTGYVATSAVLTQTSGTNKTATAQITTYRRNSTANTYGYISQGDVVLVLGARGSFTQVKYPVGSGYKYAFIKTSDTSKLSGGGSSSASVANGTYCIYAAHASNKVVDVNGASADDGANVQLFESNGSSAQKFVITRLSNGYYQIKNINGKVLDVSGAERRGGANVIQWSWNGGANQQWKFVPAGNGYYYIENALGYYLDVYGAGTENGTNIMVWEKNYGPNQQFRLVSAEGTAASSAESQITSRLNAMMDGSYGNGAYRLNTKYTGVYSSEQCKGFAKRLHEILFGYNIGSTKGKPNNYQISISSSKTRLVGSLTSLSSQSDNAVRGLFANARPGDFIQVRRSHSGSHSMIFLSADSNSVTVYECNVDGNNGIQKATYSYSSFRSANAAVSVYTAVNYYLH